MPASDAQERTSAVNLAQHIALTNGYTEGNWPRRRRRPAERSNPTTEESSRIAFCLPFISDEMSRAVRASLRKADLDDQVRVVEIPPTTLKTQLIRNRIYDRLCLTPDCVIRPFGKEGDCMVSGVIYLITCQTCGDHYIGETGRPLCVWVKEHLDGMNKSNPSTPLGAHRRHSHDNVLFKVAVTILSFEPEIIARRTLEAFWITARNPKMNRKEE